MKHSKTLDIMVLLLEIPYLSFQNHLAIVTYKRHQRLLNMTGHHVNNIVDTLDQAYTMFVNLIKIISGQTQNQRIFIRSILPLEGILGFLFGTADQKDLDEIKKNIKIIYENQIKQGKVLDDSISITNILGP